MHLKVTKLMYVKTIWFCQTEVGLLSVLHNLEEKRQQMFLGTVGDYC